jgi:hypothetical protein
VIGKTSHAVMAQPGLALPTGFGLGQISALSRAARELVIAARLVT